MAKLPHAGFHTRAGATLLVLTITGALAGQTKPPASLADADNAIEGLREVTSELTSTVSDFHRRLDDAISHRDRGYRSADGRRVLGADVDVTTGQADVIQSALRKSVAFRMLGARGGTYQPEAAADMDRIQDLIAEERRRVEASSAVIRRLLVVSVNDIDRNADAQVKLRHQRLLRARAEAQEAARMAFLELPIDLPQTEAAEESAQKAWDMHLAGKPITPNQQGSRATARAQNGTRSYEPLRIERRRRFTLIREGSLRMALTDAGLEDSQGRHLFYQEEWIQRGPVAIWMRWRVAVEPSTGQHILIKRYAPVEFTGFVDEFYQKNNRMLWAMEPVDDATEPARDEVESAMADVARSREAIHNAAQDFRTAIRQALLSDDRMRDAANEVRLDGGLSPAIRESLFAIRGHMAGVRAIVQLEGNVRNAIAQGDTSVGALEPLAAWGNRAGTGVVSRLPAAEWERLLEQCDREIDALRSAEVDAMGTLPPDTAQAEAHFPALDKNLVVRMRGIPSRNAVPDGLARYLQEIWRRENTIQGATSVRRTATVMVIDPKTGAQTRAASNTKYYPIGPDGSLEETYDEYASQALIVTGTAYEKH